MAEESNRKFEIPWSTWLPLVAVVGGIIAQYRPLTSARPPVPAEKSIEIAAAQDADARLWQDPLAVAEKQARQLAEAAQIKKVPEALVARHAFPALLAQKNELTSNNHSLLILAVMLNSGPYSEQSELRLRAREAVLEGLSESHFVPVDGEHIGYVTTPWPLSRPDSSDNLLIPWEVCIGEASATWKNALVLWLPASGFGKDPLQRLGELIGQLRNELTTVKILGPPTSNGLQTMLKEVDSNPSILTSAGLKGVTLVSAKATAAPNELLPRGQGGEDDLQQAFASKGGLEFVRTIASDLVLRDALLGELALRGVGSGNDRKPSPVPSHVVILSEWDSKYGRSWAKIFQTLPDPRGLVIHTYHYLHGIDGRLPGDVAKAEPPAPDRKVATAASATVESTEGHDQSDFLRRLARELKNEDTHWRRQDGSRVRAIGLLGTDVFDKLMILRALRPEFPVAVFFTNNYDAHLETRDVWSDTHNLVIASPFGSVVPGHQAELAPFRDSDQTSMFVATLISTGEMTNAEAYSLFKTPYLFEVGRNGVQQLKTDGQTENVLPTSADPAWFKQWFAIGKNRVALFLTVIFLILLAIWFRRLAFHGREKEPLHVHVLRTMARSPCLVILIPLVFLLVCYISQLPGANQEPLAFSSGISVWPSEMIRLIAFLLTFHFLFKANLAMRDNELEINKAFDLHPSQAKDNKDWWFGISGLQNRHPEWFKDQATFPVEEIWQAYLRFNRSIPRFIRIAIYFTIYLFFCFSLVNLFERPIAPARGEFAHTFDLVVLYLVGLGLIVLTFSVVDALQLSRNFILLFARGIATWPPKANGYQQHYASLTQEQLSPYHSIRFIAKRTEVVAGLIWYPLVIITLLCLARLSIFDDWTWPAMLLLIYGLNAAWALGSAILFGRAAERLRGSALQSLSSLRRENYEDSNKRSMITELMDEIKNLKQGAFAPLREQPFVRAILVPSGSVGALAVLQRLFDFF